jgi:hypothetical protein
MPQLPGFLNDSFAWSFSLGLGCDDTDTRQGQDPQGQHVIAEESV